MGIVSLAEALRLAGELDVDLVEIAATASPPVCRLMDYGKFKYQEQKKAAEAKAKQKVIEVKEIKFRPGTDDGDYNIKMRNIKRFLDDGDKCKITLRFRGREITHQEIGLALLQRIRDDLGELIIVEQSLFGTKTFKRPAGVLAAIHIGDSGIRINNVPVQELKVQTSDGKKHGFFTHLTNEELHWLATHLRHATGGGEGV